jgi:cysteine-rich repeat protein
MKRRVISILSTFVLAAGTTACGNDDAVGNNQNQQNNNNVVTACGNGALETGELCDGADLDGTACEDLGFVGGNLECDENCIFDDSGCTGGCGDGIVDAANELCDGTDLDAADCGTEGYWAGVLVCSADCQGFDTSGCCSNGCPEAGDTQCASDILSSCGLQATGCLEWVDTDCSATGGTCHDTMEPAFCGPACTDECPVDGEARCEPGGTRWMCYDNDSDGCLDVSFIDCPAQGDFCDDSVVPAVCVANGSGDSCQDAIVLQQFPARFTGADITVDFPTDSHDLNSGANCADAGGPTPDAVFRVELQANDSVVVSEHGEVYSALHIVPAHSGFCLNTFTCLASVNSDENVGLQYGTSVAQTVYVVVEPLNIWLERTDYDIRIDVVPATCGDGFLSPGEACDDGNTTNSDGCASDC